MILCKDEENYQRCYAIANRGLLPNKEVNPFGLVGENYQLSELQAALAQTQLDQLEELGAQREKAMIYLDKKLATMSNIKIFQQFEKTERRAQMRYSFLVEPEERDTLFKHLQEKGIPILKGYSSVTKEERLQGWFDNMTEYPNALKAQTCILSVFHPFLLGDEGELDKLAEGISSFKL